MDAMISRQDFEEDFSFGAATSAYQIEGAATEGGRGPSIWDTFTHKYPGSIADGKNGNVAIDSYNRYKEDVQIMKKLGFTAYRFSISWPRVLPSGRISGGVNKEGVDFYSALIDELLENGIKPYATLFHWDLPQALEDEYQGFLSDKIVEDFHQFADVCFWEFGDRVKHWLTFNESWSYSVMGYVNGFFPPGRGGAVTELLKRSAGSQRPRRFLGDSMYSVRPGETSAFRRSMISASKGNPGTEPYTVTHNQLLCHADTVQLYREKYKPFQMGLIGIAPVSIWVEPLNPNSQEDLNAARRAVDFMYGWVMDPVTYGDYPASMRQNVKERLPKFSDVEKALLKESYDFLGVNYYTTNYATTALPEGPPNYNTDSHVELLTERNGVPIGDMPGTSWLYVYPEGLRKLLVFTKDTYYSSTFAPPIYITENGVNEYDDITTPLPTIINDQHRIDYYQSHLAKLRDAIHEGVNVKGYFAWSLMDNFEWADGYKVRFGMTYIDYNKGLARNPKESAKWFRKFLLSPPTSATAKKRGLPYSYPADGPAAKTPRK